jgi:serine/threonine-protein kinase
MGDVFLAVNLGPSGVSKLIVVKELREQLASVPEARSMFLDEARIATRLNHPNVVQTLEAVEDGESLYLTMEYVEGQALQNIVRGPKRALVPLAVQLHILADVLAALHYAHTLTDYDGTPLNVVHRDVSPHNVLVTYEGGVKLVDFGIAKAADAKTVTESGVFKGKVRFSSPEQVIGTPVDPRSDVFAAGAVLWEILAGEQMWKGVPDTKVLVELASGRIPSPRSVVPSVPEALDAICTRAMAFEADDRYPTAAAFREALLDSLRESGEAEVAIGPVLSAAFADEQRAMRATVDAEIRAIREASSESIRLRRIPVLSVPPPAEASRGTGLAHAQTSRQTPKGKVVVPIALGVCCALAMALYAAFPAHPHQVVQPPQAAQPMADPPAPAPSSQSAPSDAVPAPAPSAAARTVHVRLSAQPAAARFVIDGAVTPSNPYDIDVPSDGAVHKIVVQAPGFETRSIPATFDRDVVLDVSLSGLEGHPRPGHSLSAPVHAAPPIPGWKAQPAIEEEGPYKR